jgi:indolepyruvate ferredoxin oxidoreductase alpha subunit
VVRALGVEKVMSVDAFDVKEMARALKACTEYDGTAVLIAEGPCVFVSRNPQPAYIVDPDTCVACGTCAKVGCPGVVRIEETHPKTGRKKAGIDPVLCVGCDICRQVCPTGAIRKPL